jgi:hypothetical protein
MIYKNWHLKTHQQVHYPPYKDFTSICRKTIGNKTFGFSVEGNSLKQVINVAKERIDNREFDTIWDKDVMLSPCNFE